MPCGVVTSMSQVLMPCPERLRLSTAPSGPSSPPVSPVQVPVQRWSPAQPLTVKAKDARIVGGLWDPRNEDVVEGVAADVLAWAGGNWVRTAVDTGNGSYALDIASGLWHVGYRVDPRSGYVGLRQHKNVPVPANATVPVPLPVVPRDGALAGTVLGPDGDPLSGAKVIADGIGPEVQNLWLTTYTDEQGLFRLPVPHGVYRLGATVGITDSIKNQAFKIYNEGKRIC